MQLSWCYAPAKATEIYTSVPLSRSSEKEHALKAEGVEARPHNLNSKECVFASDNLTNGA